MKYTLCLRNWGSGGRRQTIARLLLGTLVALVALVVAPRVAFAGTCKLSIVVDRSGSMMAQRSDGSKRRDGVTPQTRCYAAGMATNMTLGAYWEGKGFDITLVQPGVSGKFVDPEYTANCPNQVDRLADVYVFELSRIIHLTPGFVPVATALGAWQSSPYWDSANDETRDTCEGDTPLAQTMCLSARVFPAGLPPAGEVRRGWTFTDGGENSSDVVPPTTDQETRCRLPGEPLDPGTNAGGWGDRVIGEYVARGIQGHGFLFAEGATPLLVAQSAAMQALIREPHGALVARSVNSSATSAASMTPDQLLLTTLANRTGGAFNLVLDSAVIAPSNVNTDIDGDGIPDWRDFCPFNACAGTDFDKDGIPDNLDLCPATEKEDGNGAYPADGCRDSDSDGVRDELDGCPGPLEDYFPPKVTDGCPRPATAAPAASAPMIGLLAFVLLGSAALVLRGKREAC